MSYPDYGANVARHRFHTRRLVVWSGQADCGELSMFVCSHLCWRLHPVGYPSNTRKTAIGSDQRRRREQGRREARLCVGLCRPPYGRPGRCRGRRSGCRSAMAGTAADSTGGPAECSLRSGCADPFRESIVLANTDQKTRTPDRIDAEPMPTGAPAVRTIAMPSDTNPAGDIFGGWLMSQMESRGTMCTRPL